MENGSFEKVKRIAECPFSHFSNKTYVVDTQRIDLSAKAHHALKVGFVFKHGMYYSKHLR